MYDGFYAVITNLEGDVSEIIKINKQRWEIKENFRLMDNPVKHYQRICTFLYTY